MSGVEVVFSSIDIKRSSNEGIKVKTKNTICSRPTLKSVDTFLHLASHIAETVSPSHC